MLDRSTGEVRRLRCGSWRCDVCSVSNAWAFKKRLRMGLLTGHAGGSDEIPKLLTLTSQPLEQPWQSRRLLGRRFAEVRRRVERALPGCRVEFAGTVERTERGAVHFHVVLRGVPFMPQAVWSRLVASCGFGRIVDIRRVRSDEVAGYMVKQLGAYLTKQAGSASWPAHFRRVRFSRQWAPEWLPRGRRPRQEGADESTWVLLTFSASDNRRSALMVAGQGRSEIGGAAADP